MCPHMDGTWVRIWMGHGSAYGWDMGPCVGAWVRIWMGHGGGGGGGGAGDFSSADSVSAQGVGGTDVTYIAYRIGVYLYP